MDLRPATRASRGSSRGAVDSSPVTAGAAVARLSALPAFARQTTGNITGRIIDAQAVDNKGIVVNVGESPLIETRSSSVGGVVDVARIENLPLNGRQFANLAVTVPGVGLGFHSDRTKSSQLRRRDRADRSVSDLRSDRLELLAPVLRIRSQPVSNLLDTGCRPCHHSQHLSVIHRTT